jgi:hypothetical protein
VEIVKARRGGRPDAAFSGVGRALARVPLDFVPPLAFGGRPPALRQAN